MTLKSKLLICPDCRNFLEMRVRYNLVSYAGEHFFLHVKLVFCFTIQLAPFYFIFCLQLFFFLFFFNAVTLSFFFFFCKIQFPTAIFTGCSWTWLVTVINVELMSGMAELRYLTLILFYCTLFWNRSSLMFADRFSVYSTCSDC